MSKIKLLIISVIFKNYKFGFKNLFVLVDILKILFNAQNNNLKTNKNLKLLSGNNKEF